VKYAMYGVLVAILGGCAVVPIGPVGVSGRVYLGLPPIVVAPAPAYVVPAYPGPYSYGYYGYGPRYYRYR
jgi:hypothetical protein